MESADESELLAAVAHWMEGAADALDWPLVLPRGRLERLTSVAAVQIWIQQQLLVVTGSDMVRLCGQLCHAIRTTKIDSDSCTYKNGHQTRNTQQRRPRRPLQIPPLPWR